MRILLEKGPFPTGRLFELSEGQVGALGVLVLRLGGLQDYLVKAAVRVRLAEHHRFVEEPSHHGILR